MFMISLLLKKLIRGYQKFISPVIPARCRYYPTCSEYGLQAISWHGTARGSLLLTKRICSCHPLGGHGIDFVPLPLYKYQFYYIDVNQPSLFTTHYFVYKDTTSYSNLLNYYLKQPV